MTYGLPDHYLTKVVYLYACKYQSGETMETRVKWVGNATFIGTASSGHTVLMDGPTEGGGQNFGPRPMEMLILGMGACSAYDVVSILKKSRLEIADCEIKITSQRADNNPKVFTNIQLHFIVSGRALKEKQVERAIKLSAEKYCSASIMLGATAKINHDFEIVDVD